jgi:hypothetical protein
VTRPQQSPVTHPVVVLTKPSTQALTKPLPQKSTQKVTHDDSDSSSSSVMSVSTYENWDDSDGGSNVTEETDSQSCVDPINVKIRLIFNFKLKPNFQSNFIFTVLLCNGMLLLDIVLKKKNMGQYFYRHFIYSQK